MKLRIRIKDMLLVQILDIHIGSLFNQDLFDRVVEEINELDTDAINCQWSSY
jgi:hypothetical protein